MDQFMLVFRGADEQMMKLPPDKQQEGMQKWFTWITGLKNEGTYISGAPLIVQGKVVHAKNKITDGPFAEGKELIGGFIIIQAESIDNACQIAFGCPIYEYGGTTEVRPVRQMPG